MKNTTKRMVQSALFTALVCIATMIIKIPSPLKGYMNLGDAVVLTAGWMLSPAHGFLAAGLGSALADIFSGYAVYAPATFLIKGLMAFIVHFGFKIMNKKIGDMAAKVICGVTAEIEMILGYLIFEGVLYGFGPSLVNIPANAVQGVAGLILGIMLSNMLKKTRLW